MFLSNIKKSQYNTNGFICFEKMITTNNCKKIIKIVNRFEKKPSKKKNELDKNHSFSKISNSNKVVILDHLNNQKLEKLIDFTKIEKIASRLTNTEMKVWFKKFYPKNNFDGDNEFYHQDFAYHKDKKAKNQEYIQCFIALQDHYLESGCLRVFKGSHKLGLIKHHVVMTRNGVSKLTPSSDQLKKISKKNKMLNLELKAGSCVFFNYQLIHGSSSNASKHNQLRMVVQLLQKKNNRNKQKNNDVWKKRNLQEISLLKKFINLKNKLGQAKN
jgi:ectoine hydroxylase-related dioxygenase (phytanoyl-CoA dioxygenase family)